MSSNLQNERPGVLDRRRFLLLAGFAPAGAFTHIGSAGASESESASRRVTVALPCDPEYQSTLSELELNRVHAERASLGELTPPIPAHKANEFER